MEERHGTLRRDEIAWCVRSFYDELPFNFHGTLESARQAIERPTVASHFPDLHDLIEGRPAGRRSVLDVGCGAGWLAHSLRRHYGARVHGIDLSARALERANELVVDFDGSAGEVSFALEDVFHFASDQAYDVGVSMGALHHTADPRAAFEIQRRHVRPGGALYLGLYHAPGRRVFLDALESVLRDSGEEAAFEAYCRLDRVRAGDRTLARSWFRDQVLHPHESQHTLREVAGWFDDLGVELVSTSINRFAPWDDRSALFDLEHAYEGAARRAIHDEGRFFPGFFTVLGRVRA